jgi:hypothetical protein
LFFFFLIDIFKMSESDVTEIPKSTQKWYHWYSPDDTKEEKRLLLKLDLLIVPYAFALFWVQFVDEGNISMSAISYYAPVYFLITCRQCLRIGHGY